MYFETKEKVRWFFTGIGAYVVAKYLLTLMP